MARDKEKSVALPLAASGVLGLGAYGSHRVNRFMNDLGIKENFKLNPDAINAFDDYTGLKAPKDHPELFAHQYAQTASRAGSAPLFLGDPLKQTAWEWDINNRGMREAVDKKLKSADELLAKISGKIKKNKLPAVFQKWVDKLQHRVNDLRGTFSPLEKMVELRKSQIADEMVRASIARGEIARSAKAIADSEGIAIEEATKKAIEAAKANILTKGTHQGHLINLLSHVPAMAQGPTESYVRLLHEIAPNVNAHNVAANTAEALMNYKNPTYKDYAGRSFKSPGEYLNTMWAPKGHKLIPGAFDDYINSVSHTLKNNPTNVNGGLEWEIRKLLAPSVIKDINNTLGPGSLHSELTHTIGARSKWDPVFDETGKKILGIKQTAPTKLRPGITAVQDIVDKSMTHPGLKFLNALATVQYAHAAAPYKLLTDGIRKGMAIRNKKLRLGLMAGSAGLGALGISNFAINRDRRKRRGVFGRIMDKVQEYINR